MSETDSPQAANSTLKCAITGATGYIGAHLLRWLLSTSRNRTFLVLARSSDRADKLRQFLGRHADRVRIVLGDLTHSGLGLDGQDRIAMSGVDELWHVAGLSRFEGPYSRLAETNVAGTARLIECLRHGRNTPRVILVSTAYSGRPRVGRVLEEIPDGDIEFVNDYERSKHEAERIVRDSGLCYTVVRPSVVVGPACGDDDAPVTPMMYDYLKALCAVMVRHGGPDFVSRWCLGEWARIRVRLIGNPAFRKNFICVDDLVERVTRIVREFPEGGVFNLVNSCGVPLENLRISMQRALHVEGIEYVGQSLTAPSRLEETFHRIAGVYDEYLMRDDPEWETSIEHDQAEGAVRTEMNQELADRLVDRYISSVLGRLARSPAE